ncbi:MAG: cytochrome C [Calditrichaeota bacterium]|nr:MAG: cytochrome C [Calditrichota bacterium]
MKRFKHILFITAVLLPFKCLFAQLSPGDLHRSHAFLEGLENCTKCHESGRKLNPDKCLDCHVVLKKRIDNKKGLHAGKKFKDCATCHVEHHGRDFDLIYWENGRNNFDHKATGYTLEGAHAKQKCRDCHAPQNIRGPDWEVLKKAKKKADHTYLGLNTDCLSCHRDEHRGQLSEKCTNCHNFKAWSPAPGFDHGTTKYPLTGLHKKVKCAQCHKTITDNKYPKDKSYVRFAGLRFPACINCHKDPHQNKFGSRCRTCHVTDGWKQYNKQKFNHDKTRYPLEGRHRDLACEACHKPGQPLRIKRFSQCRDCHRDAHAGQFLHSSSRGACAACHDVNGFKPAHYTIQEHQTCAFPLEGAHRAVPCIACHKQALISGRTRTMQFRFKNLRCQTCHDDVHKGTVNRWMTEKNPTGRVGCRACHSSVSWSDIAFDHDQTDFPLQGRHKDVACKKCHYQTRGAAPHWRFTNSPTRCASCHNDIHRGQFASSDGQVDCVRCHTPDNWKAEKFNHETDSRFKLEGAHESVACVQCHKPAILNGTKFVKYKPLDMRCEACHG